MCADHTEKYVKYKSVSLPAHLQFKYRIFFAISALDYLSAPFAWEWTVKVIGPPHRALSWGRPQVRHFMHHQCLPHSPRDSCKGDETSLWNVHLPSSLGKRCSGHSRGSSCTAVRCGGESSTARHTLRQTLTAAGKWSTCCMTHCDLSGAGWSPTLRCKHHIPTVAGSDTLCDHYKRWCLVHYEDCLCLGKGKCSWRSHHCPWKGSNLC